MIQDSLFNKSAVESLRKGIMYTDHGKRKERRKAALDEAWNSYAGWTYQGGVPIEDLCENVKSCRYANAHINMWTLREWIRTDLKDSYLIVRHHWRYWVHRK